MKAIQCFEASEIMHKNTQRNNQEDLNFILFSDWFSFKLQFCQRIFIC